jgi:flavin reductase (DIM6/NTAB) family NADH-FMN oxidoreductase RutF
VTVIDPARLSPGAMYRFMISAIVPRPIAFVSTVGEDGVANVAPFSYFVPLTNRPPLLGISVNARRGAPKDTLRNMRGTGDFVVNVVDAPLLDRMVHASGEWPPETSEFALTGLTAAASDLVRAPRVAECPVSFECRLHQEVPLGETTFVVGEILRAHVRDGLLDGDGLVDPQALQPIGRLGGDGYSVVSEVLHRARPRVDTPPRP